MVRSAQNLAKYVIHAMFHRLGGLKPSQNTRFTPCFNASEGSEPRKICDSRKVAMLRIAQNLAKFVIHAGFQWFEVRSAQNLAKYVFRAMLQRFVC